jgi:GTP-binding protein
MEERGPGQTSGPRLPLVAIVGRPNVGKSTLFNRLVRAPRAIVDATPGVTRDRNIAAATWHGRRFLLVDTGGVEEGSGAPVLAASVRAQTEVAAREADAVIVMFDGRAGVNPLDRDLMERFRRLDKPVVYAVNKLDSEAREDDAADFFSLGLPEVVAISASHGRGIAELMDRIFAHLPAEPTPACDDTTAAMTTLAIVGRPNVGKSSLVNSIVGFERAIVDARPGTTRDPLDTPIEWAGRAYSIVDTAGIRRRPRVHEDLERASVVRALRALERAEAAILVIDATVGMADQDARIAGYAWERGRALLLVFNKWDAVPRERRDARQYRQAVRDRYPTLGDVPVLFVSALTGAGVQEIAPVLKTVVAAHRQRLRTVDLNRVVSAATAAVEPASVHGKRPRILYAAQTGMAPPAVTIFANAPERVQAAYARYLGNALRRAFDLRGVPLRLQFRQAPKRPAMRRSTAGPRAFAAPPRRRSSRGPSRSHHKM